MTSRTVSPMAKGVDQASRLLCGGERLVSIFGSLDPAPHRAKDGHDGDPDAPPHRAKDGHDGDPVDGARCVHYVIDVANREYRVLSAPAEISVPSLTAISPAAAWYERELHDQYGVAVQGHPDLRPLLFHENWPGGVHPMAPGFASVGEGGRAPYPFLRVGGVGVCEVPVGPVHAGIIEPGHFRFSQAGDRVLHLELRHFYTHKGTEKLMEGAPAADAVMLAESVSGDNCLAHAVAYSQAVEAALGIVPPQRACALRLVGLELERMLAHIADVGALCGDVAFVVPAAYTARLKEALLRASTRFLGTRFWRGITVPGGVRCDLDVESARDLAGFVAEVARDFAELARIVLETPSVQNRFETTGTLSRNIARDLAVVGPVARASGIDLDVRRDHPYGHYRHVTVDVPHFEQGDVLARARIRIEETAISARLISETLNALPDGPVCAAAPGERNGEGYSAVESPRGELFYWVRIRDGRIARCHIKSPSFQNWPALPLAMPGNIIADFPLVNKSFNLSYSGCDR